MAKLQCRRAEHLHHRAGERGTIRLLTLFFIYGDTVLLVPRHTSDGMVQR